jgi:sialic acid synthase SpsE
MLPKHLPDVIGKKAVKDIKRGTPLSIDMIK